MAVIDSNNFITHLVWGGLIDKATCGELKEAIELCTVKDIYTKADMVAMLTDIQLEIEEKEFLESSCSFMDKTEEKNYAVYTDDISKVIQQKIDALKMN